MMKVEFPTLYKRTSSGRIQQWTIHTKNNKYYTIAGMVGGSLTKSKKTICLGKNIGRSNQTSPKRQAIKEAKAKHQKKIENGWTDKIKQVDNTPKFLEPMLARNYKDLKDKLEFPVFSQPKLDGIRCIASKHGLFSRQGKKFVCCPHIEDQLIPLFEHHPEIILDGEFYNHSLCNDFNEIVSLVRKTVPTKKDLRRSEEIVEFHVFDILGKNIVGKDIGARPFDVRLARLVDYSENFNFVLVQTHTVQNEKELDERYDLYQSNGYEGQMIRIVGPYEPKKRSKFLLKRKEFIDEEFTIVSVKEGKGKRAGMMGRFVLTLPNGNKFKSSAKGTEEMYRKWFENRRKLIGKQATVRFQNYTPDGVPRFPRIVAVRDYE